MALSTTSSSTAAPWRVNAAAPTRFCALVCAASAGVHGALVIQHTGESTQLAAAFAAATVALAIAALAEALVATPLVSSMVAALLLTVATSYLLSRTSGIPGLTPHPEPFDALGSVISALEVAAAAVALRHTYPRRH
jgi:hypothetical protein